jgi:hypothetical protein
MKMKKNTKRITTIYIEEEVWRHINQNHYIKNLSEWVNSRYKKEFMDLEGETKRLDCLLREVEKCKERIRSLKKEERPMTISREASNWIKTVGVKRAERATIEGVLKYFNNKFNENLSLRQFRILLNKYKECL